MHILCLSDGDADWIDIIDNYWHFHVRIFDSFRMWNAYWVLTLHLEFLFRYFAVYLWWTLFLSLNNLSALAWTCSKSIESNLYLNYFLQMYFVFCPIAKVIENSIWITFQKSNLYFVIEIQFKSNWSNSEEE